MKSTCLIILTAIVVALAGCGDKSDSKYSRTKNLVEDVPAERRADIHEDFLCQTLGLTPEQSVQVNRINKKYAYQVDAILLSDDWRSRKARRFKSAMKSKDRELKKVFTKEQYKRYEQIKEEMKQKLRNTR